jgi:mono/diheme cytochrome c family protein
MPTLALMLELSVGVGSQACRANVSAPKPPTDYGSPERIARGRTLFLQHCTLCHGERGDGRGQRREGLDRAPRDFTSAAWRSSMEPSRAFLAIRDGVAGSPMPGWEVLGEDGVWDLTAHVLSIAPQGEAATP